jgi:hypothetical protein
MPAGAAMMGAVELAKLKAALKFLKTGRANDAREELEALLCLIEHDHPVLKVGIPPQLVKSRA